MEDTSIFMEKETKPCNKDLVEKLGVTYNLWVELERFVLEKYPGGKAEWNYPGKKYGWNFRIKDKKRAIIYFLPRENYFKVVFVFGQKATDLILESSISVEIKNELSKAKKYAEGRGISIDIKNDLPIPDINKLVEIKLAY